MFVVVVLLGVVVAVRNLLCWLWLWVVVVVGAHTCFEFANFRDEFADFPEFGTKS